ncbi:ABC transporter permease [Celeribacter indicus]|uniref:ABC transporter permease n=1 Tax=Celeribacter indicus TaxID=1208324 RepID=A0A0B5E8V8_9RHOB|nr:ABC transporter permease [Celeribacter indicus]AJE48747.1 ABC transporter permease [Celeribacter indicus]SDX11543.1 peptide/nickel transport system permease protein [Celeribacter indicus]
MFDAVAPVETRLGWIRLLLRNPNALAGLGLLALIVALAGLADVLTPGSPMALVGRPLQWPNQNPAFPLGTDSLGRDVLAGLLHGARVSLFVGITSAVIALAIGVTVGGISGYAGGLVDDLIVRLIEIFQTIPHFVLLVVLVAFVQPSVATVITGIALVSWDNIARLTRAEVRSLRQREFVAAARASGFGPVHILWREILPNALPPLIVAVSITIASAVLMESALSFMGLGDPNAMTWGTMIGIGREYVRSEWFLTVIPGLAIVLTVLAFNLIGDGLNDALNPRLRHGGRP